MCGTDHRKMELHKSLINMQAPRREKYIDGLKLKEHLIALFLINDGERYCFLSAPDQLLLKVLL